MANTPDSIDTETWSPKMGLGGKIVAVVILLAMAATGVAVVVAMLRG